MMLAAVDVVLCLLVAAAIAAFGYLTGEAYTRPAEKLEPRPRPQTFDEWRATGHQAWPAVTRAPAALAVPSSAPSVIGPTSPDAMALDVEAMILLMRAEIGELIDDANRKIGALTHA